MRLALALGTCLVAFAGAGSASARPPQYLRPAQMRATIERHGFTVSGERLLVQTATCSGLRRYGMRGGAFGGFACSATAPDGSVYRLRTRAVTATRFDVVGFGIVSTADESVANCLDFGGTAPVCIKQLSG